MGMRRRVGVGGIQKKRLEDKKFVAKADELAENQLAELSSQLSSFQGNLETFAREHKQEIRKDPEFRRHFQEMCSSIGVTHLPLGRDSGQTCSTSATSTTSSAFK